MFENSNMFLYVRKSLPFVKRFANRDTDSYKYNHLFPNPID